ncbi:preprotein translocase subunit SecA [Ectothiorhodospira lacustris]|uniref:preprotein translocase subunit SecA n=1 Tax=Ectothiorhodospira lacustris TaxID=2899127 RepID=UPI001EE90DE2|nr:preprotein translocase subunit SecA [Ectothiorhodospira lacustris]MCG5500996.1 preprotein translocase subunit SecA [Ectothiorhodospira lacustris]MCG5510548.1 preprotein translocase subunit SecA [Ectothiorhodospira lacustris]MCG5521240.1 preprotein translocase subunit SecA [Ectothiorhodospira lacustris]
MVTSLVRKIFGSRNDRLVKRYGKQVGRINEQEADLKVLTDEQLRARTGGFRDRLGKGESLDDLLPEAFALVREAGRRIMGMRHFDVQLIGGMVLNDGRIAEMRTGEGKTLVATLSAYLNALPGKGVHVITVNDYLARRDAAWMGRLYHGLGLSVGVVNSSGAKGAKHSYLYDPDFAGDEEGYVHLRPVSRREAYAADITYGTNNEFGFDYLRDNMAFRAEDRVQRDLAYAIVDEVDSILIDEARTPLIISGPTGENSELYQRMKDIVPTLQRQEEEESEGDYYVDEKVKQVFMSEDGQERAEQLLKEAGLLKEDQSLYDAASIPLLHHLNAALRAHAIFQRDVHYLVRDKQVLIIDEFTGRVMPGRRWSEGLHQAVEAKEGVPIQNENQTLASITFQNYFRLYKKLSGMTGTADTEAYEFQHIYGLEVVVIPTNKPMVRNDMQDLVYMTQKDKYKAIIEDIKHCREQGQPVLVGTASVEASEILSDLLKKAKINHEVLNAKQHEREAHIVAQAGRPGAVTIATNMAGRGTDIVLGGSLDAELEALGPHQDPAHVEKIRGEWQQRHDQVLGAGGLHIIGSERHESRRIDNQLRGRAGRQGDPGSSRFFLSLEDTLMRIFASDRVKMIMQKLGMEEGEAIENAWVTKAIENAQRKVEGHNFDIRKNLLEYDDVANDQRRVVYEQRRELLDSQEISDTIRAVREDVVDRTISRYIPPGSIDEQWDIPGLTQAMESEFGLKLDVAGWLEKDDDLHEESLRERLQGEVSGALDAKRAVVGAELMQRIEKDVMLQVLDSHWKEHLASMDYLRQGIGLRGYAQRNPKQEYKREAFAMFESLLERIKHDVISMLMRLQVQSPDDVATLEAQALGGAKPAAMEFKHDQPDSPLSAEDDAQGKPEESDQEPYRREGPKLGRNDPCWCGSGKKYKHCHGRLE